LAPEFTPTPIVTQLCGGAFSKKSFVPGRFNVGGGFALMFLHFCELGSLDSIYFSGVFAQGN
jgi:hypothetical protein